MKVLPVRWSRRGAADLTEIADDISEATLSTRLAMTYVARIAERCTRIGHAPHSGRIRDDLAPGLRTIPFERSALICYVIENETVWITNVFRRGRDVEAILRGDAQRDADE